MGERVYTDLHFYCGIGGTAIGTAKARAIVGGETARFRHLGGIDFDAAACRDFTRLTGAPALCADVHKLQPGELLRFAGARRPDAVFSSPPCKGFSRLLSSKKAAEPKYVEMNTLLLRALFLLCSTWDEPPPLMFFENVPGIMSRGRALVEQASAMLIGHGYAVDVGNHDCGEIGGLAQRRPRWFMVARHRTRMPHVVYQPAKQRVRACGEVIGPMPLPGDVVAGGAMHAVPKLSWENWKRLAAIPAGGDWRDLAGTVPAGKARREVHRRHAVISYSEPAPAVTGPGGHAAEAVADPRFGHVERVTPWDDPVGTITRSPAPSSGGAAVADPRPFSNIMIVGGFDEPARTVVGASRAGSGALSVADPRVRFSNALQVVDFASSTPTVIGQKDIQTGALSVADPRWGGGRLRVDGFDVPVPCVTGNSRADGAGAANVADPRVSATWQHVAGVTPWTEPGPTVTAQAKIHTGAFQIADPRSFECSPRNGAYKVLRWDQAAGTVTGALGIDNGPAAIADPRPAFAAGTAEDIEAAEAKPQRPPPFIPVIIAADGTWHRPLTTYELLALQGFPLVDAEGQPIVLDGTSHTRWRMAIGNAVPPPSGEKVGEQFLVALVRSDLGLFVLSASPVWVAPISDDRVRVRQPQLVASRPM